MTKFALNFVNISTILWLFPFITFFTSLALILIIFHQLKLNPIIIPIALTWKITWVVYFFNYDRDNWLLFFFSIFMFALVQIHYFKKQKYWLVLIVTSILAIFTKIIGIYFLAVLIVFAAYKFFQITKIKIFDKIIYAPGPTLFADYMLGLRNTEILTVQSFTAFFANHVHLGAVFAGLLLLKDNLFKLLLLSIVIVGHTLYNFQIDVSTIYKYMFFLTPLSLIIIAQVYKQLGKKGTWLTTNQVLLIGSLSVFSHLNSLSRLIGNF